VEEVFSDMRVKNGAKGGRGAGVESGGSVCDSGCWGGSCSMVGDRIWMVGVAG
jgi:hypothetical protein